MTNTELVEAVAILQGTTTSNIKKKVNTLIKLAMADIYSLVPGFWTRVNETFTLGTSGTDAYLVNLKNEFSDFSVLRFLWTTDGMIDPISEKQLRLRSPDLSVSAFGRPYKYFFREKHLIELWPRNTSSRTIHVSYRYKPAFDDIEVLPNEWSFVPFYYIMGLFEGKDDNYYKNKFENALRRMQNFAKESEEDHAVIISDGQDDIIYGEMGVIER